MFRVSGRSLYGAIALYVLSSFLALIGLLPLVFGIALIYSEPGATPFLIFGIAMIVFGLFIVAVSLFFYKLGYNAGKMKYIEIDEKSFRYFIGEDHMEREIPLNSITRVETQFTHIRAPNNILLIKNARGDFGLCDQNDLGLEIMLAAFKELVKYQPQYRFRIKDGADWMSK